jgi:TPR repeat protein
MRWFFLAGGQGHPVGQHWLGQYHEHGRGGMPRSDAAALDCYRKAAAQAHAPAQASRPYDTVL